MVILIVLGAQIFYCLGACGFDLWYAMSLSCTFNTDVRHFQTFCPQNEEILKKSIQDYQGKLKGAEQRFQALKNQAEEKLDL